MDATKIADLWRGCSPEHWLPMANRFAPAAVTAVLVLVIAHQLAEWTWLAVPTSTYDRPPPVVAPPLRAGGARAAGADLSAIAGAHLFGVAAQEAPVPQQTVVDAPETTLSVTLTGLVADDDPAGGQAIISSGRDRETTYGVGQSIEGGAGATVHAVYRDHVILNRNGRLETLRLPKKLSTSVRAGPVPAVPPVPSDNSLRELSNDSGKLTDIIRPTPQ